MPSLGLRAALGFRSVVYRMRIKYRKKIPDNFDWTKRGFVTPVRTQVVLFIGIIVSIIIKNNNNNKNYRCY